MITTPSGLQYEDTVVGTGAVAKAARKSKCITPAGSTTTKPGRCQVRLQQRPWPALRVPAGRRSRHPGLDEGVQGLGCAGSATAASVRESGSDKPPRFNGFISESGIDEPGTAVLAARKFGMDEVPDELGRGCPTRNGAFIIHLRTTSWRPMAVIRGHVQNELKN